ncbi:MAG: DUF1573 domain-containing protein [Opitutaceae bacterium]|nr:DUF1573 domain-containing protein [Opitutaceae bacterium]
MLSLSLRFSFLLVLVVVVVQAAVGQRERGPGWEERREEWRERRRAEREARRAGREGQAGQEGREGRPEEAKPQVPEVRLTRAEEMKQIAESLVVVKDDTFVPVPAEEVAAIRFFAYYYAAGWSGSCRRFTPELVAAYKELKAAYPAFGIVYMSYDESAPEMLAHFRETGMPWPAVDFEKAATLAGARRLQKKGIPNLVFLTAAGKVLSTSYIKEKVKVTTAEGKEEERDQDKYAGPRKVLEDIRAHLDKDATAQAARAAVEAAERARGALRWHKQRIEMRLTPGRKKAEATFTFTNALKRPVKITSVKTSCNCTAGKPDKAVYAPGEKGALKVHFDVGDRVGVQDNRIDVFNDADDKPVRLEFAVTIPAAMELAPRLVSWTSDEIRRDGGGGGGDAAAAKVKQITLRFDKGAGAVGEVVAKTDAGWLRVEVKPAKKGSTERILELTPSWYAVPLPWRAKITVTAKTDKLGTVESTAFATCR